MSESLVSINIRYRNENIKVEGERVIFSPASLFQFDDRPSELHALKKIIDYLKSIESLAIVGNRNFVNYIERNCPGFVSSLDYIYKYDNYYNGKAGEAISNCLNLEGLQIPDSVGMVFLAEALYLPRAYLRREIEGRFGVIEPTILPELGRQCVPDSAWVPTPKNIYPINIPKVECRNDLDFLVIDAPARNLSLMPNGLGYLYNALKKTSVKFDVLDVDIIAYHRFHCHRLFDKGGVVSLPNDMVLPEDPWQAEHYDLWTTNKVNMVEFFKPLFDEVVSAIVKAKPRILGLSIQQANEASSREIVLAVKNYLPDVVIVVGGFSCYNPDIGLRAFPEADYMCIGEADLTIGPLIQALVNDERPQNMPGVVSRFDDPNMNYIPGPMIHDLDKIDFPKYEWADLSIYRNFNGYQLTPIIASRGCRWSRCNFCAERFYWRIRTPENFANELEWLVTKGCHLFMFNESDLGGMPERVIEICDEIIRRGLHRRVKLTGQLRVNKKQDRSFFEKLREANFVALRFGIDAFSENTLRLQRKGYTVEQLEQNLKDCWESGIYTEVNWVIGVPGETEADVEEGIELILRNQKYIGRLANVNPLILVNGGVYWLEPEMHGIEFREPKDELYHKYPRALPADKWYSTNPYIDAHVRKGYFEKIVVTLHERGFPVGAWAQKVIANVRLAKDKIHTPLRADAPSSQREEVFFENNDQSMHRKEQSHESRAAIDENTIDLSTSKSNKPTKKVIELSTADSIKASSMAKPPGFKEDLVPAEFIGLRTPYKLYYSSGEYLAVPDHIVSGERVFAKDLSGLTGVLRAFSLPDLENEILASEQWANSRSQLNDQEIQKEQGSLMRVDSYSTRHAGSEIEFGSIVILSHQGQFYAINKASLGLSLDSDALKPDEILIKTVISKGAHLELIASVGSYNLMSFDGNYYALPHGRIHNLDEPLDSFPGVITAGTLPDLVNLVESREVNLPSMPSRPTGRHRDNIRDHKRNDRSSVPHLIKVLDEHSYFIMEYEGFFYGIPNIHGDIDLTTVDVLELPGVYRDQSQEAVEIEIKEAMIR